MIKQCIICNKEFNARGKQLTCSKKCSKENQRRTKQKRYTGILKACKICGSEYVAHNRSVCCSDKCRLENKKQSRKRSYKKHKPNRYTKWFRLKMWRIKQKIIRSKKWV